MSNKVLRITLDDNDPLIDDKELGVIIINSDEGTVDWVDLDGNPEHISVFDPTSSSPAYMEKTIYDTDNNNVVDNCDNLGGISAANYATQAWVLANSGGGDTMLKTVYDTNNDGIVDNSERLGGQLPSYYASMTWCVATFGDMNKSIYDTNDNGVVDDSEKLNNQDPSYYLDYNNLTNKPTFESLSDTTFTSLSAGDLVEYDGVKWINNRIIDQGTF